MFQIHLECKKTIKTKLEMIPISYKGQYLLNYYKCIMSFIILGTYLSIFV